VKFVAERMRAMKADPKLQEHTKRAVEHLEAMGVETKLQEQVKHMETLMANPKLDGQLELIGEKMKEVMADPSFQEQSKSVAEQVQAMIANPTLQEQAKLIGAQMEAMKANPNSKVEAKLYDKQVEAIKADPNFQEHVKRFSNHVEMIKADPNLQRHTRHFAEKVAAMEADPKYQKMAEVFADSMTLNAADKANHVADQVKAMQSDPNYQKYAEPILKRMEAMKSDPNFQQHEKKFVNSMESLMADPTSHEQAKQVTKQMEAMTADVNLQKHAKDLSDQMEEMMANPTLQDEANRMADQMEGKKAYQVQDSADDLVDRLLDKLADRVLMTSPLQHEDLDSTTLGKPGQLTGRSLQDTDLDNIMLAALPGNLATRPGTPFKQAQWNSLRQVAPMVSRRSALSSAASSGRAHGVPPSGLVARLVRSPQQVGSRAIQVNAASGASENRIADLASTFCNLFAVWLAIAAVAAIQVPASFTWIPGDAFTALLGLLMLSVGVTTSIDDFKACFDKPGAVAINFFACYGIMPAVAYVIAKIMGAEGAILAGLVLVGSINGGQASNLCTLIAGGDVALSVLMTTSTTLGCILMTPLICKLVLGTVVPVNALGIVISTFQVVLAPIFLGVGINTFLPKVAEAVTPFTPVAGVIATVLLVGASVAKCAETIVNAGIPLQVACMSVHLIGGILGYFATKLTGFNERTARTVAIETAMKSSAFGFLLASQHFGAFNVRVPPAVSVVWMAIIGSVMAVYWKGSATEAAALLFPVKDKDKGSVSEDAKRADDAPVKGLGVAPAEIYG